MHSKDVACNPATPAIAAFGSRYPTLPIRRDSLRQEIESVSQIFPTSVSCARDAIRSCTAYRPVSPIQVFSTGLELEFLQDI